MKTASSSRERYRLYMMINIGVKINKSMETILPSTYEHKTIRLLIDWKKLTRSLAYITVYEVKTAVERLVNRKFEGVVVRFKLNR